MTIVEQDAKLNQLNQLIKHCKKSHFYKDRLPGNPLCSLQELKDLPLTTKQDLRDQSPFGLVSVPRRQLFQYHESFGTTGVPSSVWLTRKDCIDLADSVNQGGIQFNANDIVLIRFPYALSGVAHFVHEAAQNRNACVIPASSRTTVSPFPRIVNLLKKLDVTVLAALPLQAILIAETAEMLGYDPRADFPYLRMLYTAGEMMTPQRRRLLEKIWGVPVSDNYGMTEIGAAIVDCKYGTPHPLEDKFIFEILDETLKKEVPFGEFGFLVVTTITRKGTPVIRYFTRDRARVVHTECPCGKKVMMEIRGRMEDFLIVGNTQIDFRDISEVVSALPCQRFWAAGAIGDKLFLAVEKEKSGDALTSIQISELKDRFGIDLHIEILEKGSIYDRDELLHVSFAGKPSYFYTEQEILEKKFSKSSKY